MKTTKHWMKKIKHKWKHNPCSWVVRLIVKYQFYPMQSTKLMQSLSNFQGPFL